MRYLAILKDSLVQTLDCKSLYVMLIISGLFILLCASISYSPLDERGAIQGTVESFRVVHHVKGLDVQTKLLNVTLAIGDVTKDESQNRPSYAFRLTVTGADEWRKLVRTWDAARRMAIDKEGKVPDIDVELDEELEKRFLRMRFRERMIPEATVARVRHDGDVREFDVTIRPASAGTFAGAYRVNIMFGAWSEPLKSPFNVAMFLFVIQSFLSEWCAGLVGVGMALMFTGGFVPNMLQKGSLDVLLARPVHRVTFLLLKYLGGLTYATITSVVFIGGSWLVLSARSGVWNHGYLATAGTLIFFFAVLYSVGVFFAVVTRSAIASIIVPFIVWGGTWVLDLVRKILLKAEVAMPKTVGLLLDAFYYALPKPSSLNDVNGYLMAKGSFGAALEGAEMQIPDIAWAPVVLSQVAFVVVMLALSCWIFSRKDY